MLNMLMLACTAVVSAADGTGGGSKGYTRQWHPAVELRNSPSICVGGGALKHGDQYCYCVWNENKGVKGRCRMDISGCPDNGEIACKAFDDKTIAFPSAGAGGESLGTTTPTAGMTATAIINGQPGWQDIPNSKLFSYPPSLLGRTALIPSTYIQGGYTVELDCISGGSLGKCDLFVFLYRCPPCQFLNGGNLAVDLLNANWVPYTCDVKFQLDRTKDTFAHSTIVFHKQINSGTYEDVIPQDTLELAWFAKSHATSNCGDYTDETMCMSKLPGECEWKEGGCHRVLCPMKEHRLGGGGIPKGPWADKCSTCLNVEKPTYMPTLVI